MSAFWVARRRRELAIRIAIGASPRDGCASVIARSIRSRRSGAVVGLAIALVGARVIASLLFATDPRDPATFAAVTAIVACRRPILACAIPALRAARVDPMTTLRAE